MPELKDIMAAVITLIASFAGAWAAFALESLRRNREKDERNIGAANRALYTIYGLWNVLEQYRKEVLEPYRNQPHSWLNLAAHPTSPTPSARFEVGELQFLLEQGDANVFATLLLEQQRFDLAVGLVRIRSELILNEAWPKLSARFNVGQPADQEAVERTLGVDVCHKLREMTASIFSHVDEDLVSLMAAYELLRSSMKSKYPKSKFLQVIFEQKLAQPG